MQKRKKAKVKKEFSPLSVFKAQQRWAAWKSEPRGAGKKPAKVAYYALNSRAKSDAPNIWLTHAAARRLAQQEGFDGLALLLGDLDDGDLLGGVDLDTCRDPDTGVVAPWAKQIIEKFGSYTEISPTGTGVKLFFKIAAADRQSALAVIDPTQQKRGRTWRKR